MADEKHKDFPFRVNKTDAGQRSEAFDLHKLLFKYATWEPEYSDPDRKRSFPLRELAPDAVHILAEGGYYSQRDINYLVDRLNLDVNTKDRIAFYNAFLDFVESCPWVIPVLDFEVGCTRVGIKPKGKLLKSTASKIERIRSKLMLEKMRLLNIGGLEDRLGEFLKHDSVPAPLVIGAFCEYAIDHHLQTREMYDDKDFGVLLGNILKGMPIGTTFQDDLEKSKSDGEWGTLVKGMVNQIEMATTEGERASPVLLQEIMMVISAIADTLDVITPPETFRLLAHLSDSTSRIAVQHSKYTLTNIAALHLHGINIDTDSLMRTRDDQLAEPHITSLINRLRISREGLSERKIRSDQVYALIADAIKEKRFGDSRGLIDEAEALQSTETAEKNLHAQLQGIVTAIVEGDEDSYTQQLSRIQIPSETDDASLENALSYAERTYHGSSNMPTNMDNDQASAVYDATDADIEEVDHEDIAHFKEDYDSVEPKMPEAQKSSLDENNFGHESRVSPVLDKIADKPGNGEAPKAKDTSDYIAPAPASVKAPETHTKKSSSAVDTSAKITTEDTDGIDLKKHVAVIKPPLPATLLPALFSRGLVGLAADASEALEAQGYSWPIEATVLRTAAASRAQHGDYGPEAQRLMTLANRATSRVRSDLGRNVLLGALLRPAVLQQSFFSIRRSLPDLARGSLGSNLREVAEAIAGLDFSFPPGSDVLARISGAQLLPKRKRIYKRLAEWSTTSAQKTSRWTFATGFMHYTVSDAGLIGKARASIESGRDDAVSLAHQAIAQLATTGEIEHQAKEYSESLNKPMLHLHPKGIEYLSRHFSEALGLLSALISAYEQEKTSDQRSEEQLRTTVGNLSSRINKARRGLTETTHEDALENALSDWLILKIDEVGEAIKGADTGDFATIAEAITEERDLLPPVARRNVSDEGIDLDTLVNVFDGFEIPNPEVAYLEARKLGAFDAATRLAERYDLDEGGVLSAHMVAFAKTWTEKISTRQRTMKALAKVDYSHQEEISRRLSWCDSALERIGSVTKISGAEDLDDIPLYATELDILADKINANIRADQANRIGKYRTEHNAEDADSLLVAAKSLTLEAVEDRIAQLRDGRTSATFEAELDGLVADFTLDFVEAANGPSWPRTIADFGEALETEGILLTDEARRGAAKKIFGLYQDICNGIPKGKPSASKLKAFFADLGFEDARIGAVSAVGRTKSWKMSMSGGISNADWFLPPAFGSKATNGYALFLIERDTLPETIEKMVDPEMPTILLLAGVADPARRHDFAQRLRAKAIPAILIDEALMAFTAMRRETRIRTIFECGLPYGRVEPYTTDAGHVPPEMFFGRGEEIRDIMSKTADGCLVYGGRQLGKSALISHVSRMRHSPDNHRIVVSREVKTLGNSESAEEIWSHLNAMLVPEGVVKAGSRGADAVSQDIRAWLSTRQGGRVICLFDETDNFMAADTKVDYAQLSLLKVLMEDTDRAFKVVFAGLHNVKRIHRQPNSPLAHLGRPICIGPLNRTEDDKRAAHDLVIQPMRAAGFRFESMEAVEEILAWANYYPSLVQEYARGLLSTLHGAGSGKTYRLPNNGPLWTIPTSEIFDHRGFQQIETSIREKFLLTLELDPRYALVAYTLADLNINGHENQALVSGFRASDLLEHASNFWPKTAQRPSGSAFDALLDELFDFGVLGRVPIPETKRFTYCLRTRQVAAMLGSREDIEHALLELAEKDPTVSYDSAIHRRRYAAPGNSISATFLDAAYSPLTDSQIEQLLDPEGSPLQIVCGLEILGITKVGTALKGVVAWS